MAEERKSGETILAEFSVEVTWCPYCGALISVPSCDEGERVYVSCTFCRRQVAFIGPLDGYRIKYQHPSLFGTTHD